jgi:uncharacterized protein (TIGR00251 family)
VKLQIKVIPASSKDCIAGWLEDTLKIKVKAPAEKGKANKAVIKVLEKSLALAKGSVVIESGLTSSRKTVVIHCDDEAFIKNKLADLSAS